MCLCVCPCILNPSFYFFSPFFLLFIFLLHFLCVILISFNTHTHISSFRINVCIWKNYNTREWQMFFFHFQHRFLYHCLRMVFIKKKKISVNSYITLDFQDSVFIGDHFFVNSFCAYVLYLQSWNFLVNVIMIHFLHFWFSFFTHCF